MKRFVSIIAVFLLAGIISVAVPRSEAANISKTIYTNSGSVNVDEGCFTDTSNPACSGSPPQYNLSVTQGDQVTLTFVVPGTDPYCCGSQVIAAGQFDTGTIVVGSSSQVSFTAASSFTFTSYWPSSALIKAHGTVTVNAPAPDPPDMPTSVAATAISKSQIKLTWSASAGATSYRIERNGSALTTVSGTEYIDNSLSSSTAYSYQIIAVNADGDSPASSAVAATTQALSNTGNNNTQQNNPISSPDPVEQQTPVDSNDRGELYVDERAYYVAIDDTSFGLASVPPVAPSQTFVIHGLTEAGAVITLLADGTEIAATTAGDDGKWSAVVPTKGLGSGDYGIAVNIASNGKQTSTGFVLSVTDLETAKAAQGSLVEYAPSTTGDNAAVVDPVVDAAQESSASSTLLLIAGTLTVSVVGGAIALLLHKRRTHTPAPIQATPAAQPAYRPPESVVRPSNLDTVDHGQSSSPGSDQQSSGPTTPPSNAV